MAVLRSCGPQSCERDEVRETRLANRFRFSDMLQPEAPGIMVVA
jgi:hypothetical protein